MAKERGILFSGAMVRALLAGAKTQTRRVVTPQPHRVADHIETVGKLIPGGEPIACRIPDGWAWRDLYASDEFKDDPGHFGALMRPYCPYGAPGDRLWVRETWSVHSTCPVQHLYGPLKSLGLRKYGGGEPEFRNIRVGTGDAAVAYREHAWTVEELDAAPYFRTWYGIDKPASWRPSIFMPRWASRITLEVTEVRVQRLQEISEDDVRAEGVDPGPGAYFSPYAQLWDSINGDRAPWAANPWVWAVSFRRVTP